MHAYCRALAAGLAAVCIGAAAHADEGAAYDYDNDDTTAGYSDSFAPHARYYETEPSLSAPTPRVYYAPAYTVRSNSTYYYTRSNHDHYSLSSPGYTTFYEPRLVYSYAPRGYVVPDRPAGYEPPGLSITTPAGTYAPFYGGWSPYSTQNVGGYDGYRTTPGY